MKTSWPRSKLSKLHAYLDEHLDPAEQLAQILVGVIMVLSITIYARMTLQAAQAAQEKQKQGQVAAPPDDDDDDAPDDPPTTRQLIKMALGCNLAWGVITGVMYLMNSVYDRSRPVRLQRDVLEADDDAEAVEIVQQEVDADLHAITTREERTRPVRANCRQAAELGACPGRTSSGRTPPPA